MGVRRRMGWGVVWAGGLALGAGAAEAPSAGLLNDALRTQAPAWQQLDLGGQLRLRYDDHEKAGAFPNSDFIAHAPTNSNADLQTRLSGHLGYTPVAWLTLYGEGRLNLENGDKRHPSPDANNLDFYQGYVRLGDLQAAPLQLQVGRQELIYGDQRWVGNGDWLNTGRRFDAARLRFENSFGWADAFVSHPVYIDQDHPDKWNQYEYFSGLYAASRQLAPWQDTQVYFLSYNVEAESPSVSSPLTTGPSARDVYTVGTLMKSLPGRLGGWDYSVELTGQLGTLTTNAARGERLDLRAWGAFVSGGYTCEQTWGRPRLGLGYDYGSGDSNAKDGRVGTLQNLFPTPHAFYGLMDLFGLRNMHIPRISGALRPVQDLTLTADYLWFWLADPNDLLYPESGAGRTQNGYGIHPGNSTFVGSELDLVARYNVRAWLNFQLGYGHFFVGDYLKETIAASPANGRAVDADWVYAQATLYF